MFERSAIVPPVDRQSDRARIDIHRITDARRPLEVRMPTGKQSAALDLPRRDVFGIGK
jgi:hypothetical protein